MTILNRPSDGLVSALIALRRTILACGPLAEDRLLELSAPATAVTDGKPDMARKTLGRWLKLGFFVVAGDRVDLAPQLADIPADDVDALRGAVLRLILAPANVPAPTSQEGDDERDDLSSGPASDFTTAASWILMQDPYAFPGTYRDGVETMQAQQGVEPRPFTNDTRWHGFVEWATFVGIGWVSRNLLVLDPAFAVRVALPDVFGSAQELDQETFLRRVAGLLPIVDEGRFQAIVRERVARPWRHFAEQEASPCLSAALLHLEASNDLRIETRSDAQQRALLGRGGREVRRFSHVMWARRTDA